MQRGEKGFTLIELLIVIVILGVLASLITGNFIVSLKKGNDAKRKTDLQEISKAIELYYEDWGTYPTFTGNKIPTTATSLCYANDTSKCSTKIYMQKLPTDAKSDCYYAYFTDGKTYYKIYSYIENELDSGPGVRQGGYTPICCGETIKCKFALSSPNVNSTDL